MRSMTEGCLLFLLHQSSKEKKMIKTPLRPDFVGPPPRGAQGGARWEPLISCPPSCGGLNRLGGWIVQAGDRPIVWA